MDSGEAGLGTIIGVALGILFTIGFIHIWYLVSKMREEARRQSQLLRLLLAGESIIGQVAVAETWLSPANPVGFIKLGDETWEAQSVSEIPSGSKVKIASLRAGRIVVEALGTITRPT